MRPFLFGTMMALAGGFAVPALSQETRQDPTIQAQLQNHANCICRAQGRTFAVGENACLQTPAGPRIAECGMVLNNTSWQFTERPCPET